MFFKNWLKKRKERKDKDDFTKGFMTAGYDLLSGEHTIDSLREEVEIACMDLDELPQYEQGALAAAKAFEELLKSSIKK